MDKKYTYMLLCRLQEDCYGYINHGRSLWGITPKAHADKMVELWNSLKVKPEWLTRTELKKLYYNLTRKSLPTKN